MTYIKGSILCIFIIGIVLTLMTQRKKEPTHEKQDKIVAPEKQVQEPVVPKKVCTTQVKVPWVKFDACAYECQQTNNTHLKYEDRSCDKCLQKCVTDINETLTECEKSVPDKNYGYCNCSNFKLQGRKASDTCQWLRPGTKNGQWKQNK